MANQPNPHIFGLWEETGARGGNPRRHREKVQSPQTVTRGTVVSTASLIEPGTRVQIPPWQMVEFAFNKNYLELRIY